MFMHGAVLKQQTPRPTKYLIFLEKKYLNSSTTCIENYNIFMNIVDENAIQ